MPTVQVQARLSSENLLEAAQQLSLVELDQFASQILALRARRKAPHLSISETELLLKINAGLPANVRRRYAELVEKRKAETLSVDEYQELLQLTDQVELRQARRIEHLGQLAQLRSKTLTTLMDELEIPALV